MSPTPSFGEFDALTETPPSEQRRHRRYNIRFNVQYQLLTNHRLMQRGSGTVLNISSGGVFFECHQPLPLRVPIHLILKWPVLLDGVCPLNLILRGQVLRSTSAGAAVKILSYDFYTAKRPPAKAEVRVKGPSSRQAPRLN